MRGRAAAFTCLLVFSGTAAQAEVEESLPQQVIAEAAGKVVKLYGAGGLRGLESYQTGIVITSDGLILTAASTVLDSE